MARTVDFTASGEKASKGFFAALLAAAQSKCHCEACKILKAVANELTKEFIPQAEENE